jgi:DNA segregation ATPase FtsK/SpoIIIE-like protein
LERTMASELRQRVWLDRQADQIERALTGLALPVRVNGGQVREGRVCYHLTPVGATRAEAIEGAQREVAHALGAAEVHVARETGGISLEIPASVDSELQLLPLMQALGDLPARTAVVGMTGDGHPLTLSLDEPATRHLLVQGAAGSGKSELLRSLMFSLALTSRPAHLQILGIDLTGRELRCLEAMPHALTDLASDADFAWELVDWLAREAQRRRAAGVTDPRLVLLVDGYERVPAASRPRLDQGLARCLRFGGESGVHVLLSTREGGARGVLRRRAQGGLAIAEAGEAPGRFTFRTARESTEAAVAWLPARALQRAVALARERPGASGRPRLSAQLRTQTL